MAPFFKRIVQKIPDPAGKAVIWIHGVSVGEIKSSQSLFHSLRQSHPNAFFLITTTTETGQAEAKRSLPEADAVAYLPIDIPWLVAAWARALKPHLFLLIESDFWPFLLRAIRKVGGKIVLVSGKMSERSARRFRFFSILSKKLFSLFDLICVQNEEHYSRFLPLVSNPGSLQIAGNIKFDIKPQAVDIEYWRNLLQPAPQTIAITCTHEAEEEMLLDLLYPQTEFFFLLAPRHPHRFATVAQLLDRRNIPYCRWTRLEERRGGERVILVDAMGKLSICYALSRLAVLGGSFVPIGGHNLLEPCQYGAPVLFGPHMHTQKELVSLVLASGAGRQVSSSQIASEIQSILENPRVEADMKKAALHLATSAGGAVKKTLFQLDKIVSGKKN